MKKSVRLVTLFASMAAVLAMSGCLSEAPSADRTQAQQQELLLREGTAQTGMPAIKNFRERKLLKMIYELRDQEDMPSYTYLVAQATGKVSLLCKSVGYAISDATGYTNPQRIHERQTNIGYAIMPQAEPNGLFTPDASDTAWVVCVDGDGKIRPTQIQGQFVVSPFPLQQ